MKFMVPIGVKKIQFQFLIQKIVNQFLKKRVDANKDASVSLHMPQVSAYLGMRISWC